MYIIKEILEAVRVLSVHDMVLKYRRAFEKAWPEREIVLTGETDRPKWLN